MSRVLLLAACAALLAVSAEAARAEPLGLATTQDAEGEVVAASLSGNATCTSATCVALSAMGDARGGCRNATACEDSLAPCEGFVCAALAASASGDARAYTYCDRFGQACVAFALGRDPTLYACHGDASTANYCRGLL